MHKGLEINPKIDIQKRVVDLRQADRWIRQFQSSKSLLQHLTQHRKDCNIVDVNQHYFLLSFSLPNHSATDKGRCITVEL